MTSNGRGNKKETEKGGRMLLKSNWRMNEKEQEKVDAELATSGEEGRENRRSATHLANP